MPRHARRSAWTLAALLAALAVLAGCGGGGSDPTSSPDTTPTTPATPTTPTTPVAAAPTILVQPADVQAVTAASAEFRVGADGADLQFQWQRSSDGGASWADLAGATQDRLVVPAVEAAQSGALYRVLVSRAGASTTSTAARLTVLAAVAPPVLTVSPQPAQVIAGATAQFSVTATGTGLRYRWQWYNDGGAWTDVAGADSATLVLTAVDRSFDGRLYRVLVSNDSGEASSAQVSLAVAAAGSLPAFTTTPQSIAVTAPNAARFSAAVQGDPAPQLQWQRSTDGGASWVNVADATAATLTIPATSLADNGTRYRLLAQNATGAVVSDPVTLTVTAAPAPPSFTQQPADQSAQAGATITWSALAQGNPQPAYQWQISTDGGTSWANIQGATAASYSFIVASGDAARRWRVMAINASGSVASRTIALTVLPSGSALDGRQWARASLLNTGATSSASFTALSSHAAAIDDRGRAMVVFTRPQGQGLVLWASRGLPGDATQAPQWSSPVAISSSRSVRGQPVLAAAPGGDMVAVWNSSGPCTATTYQPAVPNLQLTCYFYEWARYSAVADRWSPPATVTDSDSLRGFDIQLNDRGDLALLGPAWRVPTTSTLRFERVVALYTLPVGTTTLQRQILTTESNSPYEKMLLGLDGSGQLLLATQWRRNGVADIVAYRGSVADGLTTAVDLDNIASDAVLEASAVGRAGQQLVLWSAVDTLDRRATVAAAADRPFVSSLLDRSSLDGLAAADDGTVQIFGNGLRWTWTEAGGWQRRTVTNIDSGWPFNKASNTAVSRNGLVLTVLSGSAYAYELGLNVGAIGSASPLAARRVLGVDKAATTGAPMVSASGIGLVTFIADYAVLPSATSPAGTTDGTWRLFASFLK